MMYKKLFLNLLSIALASVAFGQELDSSSYIVKSFSAIDFHSLESKETNVQLVLFSPDSKSGQIRMVGGGFTTNEEGELVVVGNESFEVKEFGRVTPGISLVGNDKLVEDSYSWSIEPDVGMRAVRWRPFDYNVFQEGGYAIVEVDGSKEGKDRYKILSLVLDEWLMPLRSGVDLYKREPALFDNDIDSSEERNQLEVLMLGDNPVVSFMSFRILSENGIVTDYETLMLLSQSRDLKLSLLAYYLIENLEAEESLALLKAYLTLEGADTEAIALGAYTNYVSDEQNLKGSRYNWGRGSLTSYQLLAAIMMRQNALEKGDRSIGISEMLKRARLD